MFTGVSRGSFRENFSPRTFLMSIQFIFFGTTIFYVEKFCALGLKFLKF